MPISQNCAAVCYPLFLMHRLIYVGPILAIIFMGYLETAIPESKLPLLYDRFVDDAFAVFNYESKAGIFFSDLNTMNGKCRFTMEREMRGELPFMFVLIAKFDGKLRRSVYGKQTFCGLYIWWDSS